MGRDRCFQQMFRSDSDSRKWTRSDLSIIDRKILMLQSGLLILHMISSVFYQHTLRVVYFVPSRDQEIVFIVDRLHIIACRPYFETTCVYELLQKRMCLLYTEFPVTSIVLSISICTLEPAWSDTFSNLNDCLIV